MSGLTKYLYVCTRLFLLCAIAFSCVTVASAADPVPFIIGISPVSLAPGNQAATLTINGVNFAANPKVFWASTSVTVTSRSATKITVTLPAALVSVPGVGVLTVQNPGNSIKSNIAYLPVAKPFGAVTYAQTDYPSSGNPLFPVAVDLNGDGINDIVITHNDANSVGVLLGNADGTFQTEVNYPVDSFPFGLAVGDFNGDGFQDVIVGFEPNGNKALGLLLGKGDGTFQPFARIPVPDDVVLRPSVADVNHDGHLDIIVPNSITGDIYVLLGKGDGTFTTAPVIAAPLLGANVTISDFNEDGILDFAMAGTSSPNLYIFIGAGDGTFAMNPPLFAATNSFIVRATDINGDGHQDLLISSSTDEGAILLGNGDGTFQGRISAPPQPSLSIDIADLNADGHLDYIGDVGSSDFYLGNGDGTLQNVQFVSNASETVTLAAPLGNSGGIAIVGADFGGNNLNVLLQTVAAFPTDLTFPTQAVGSTSAPKVVNINNPTAHAFNISSIEFVNGDTTFFSQTNNCGISLPANSTCAINVSFVGTVAGPRVSTLRFNSDAPGGKPSINLLGAASDTAILNLDSTNANFGSQFVGVASANKTVTLHNNGTLPVNITSITLTGTNAGDYAQTNDCPPTLAAGAQCSITLTFKPVVAGIRGANVSIVSNASDRPATISLLGFGTDFTASFSAPQTVTAGMATAFQLTITPAGGFNQTIMLTCSGAPAHATCTAPPTAITPDGTNPVTIPITITTTANATMLPFALDPFENVPRVGAPQRILVAALAAFLLLLVLQKLRRLTVLSSVRSKLACAALLLAAVTLTACGGGNAPRPPAGGTPAGTYTITVTATVGALSHTSTAQLTVQ